MESKAKPAFYRLKVSRVEPQTRNAVAVEFEVPPELEETFAFEAGQYLTLRLQQDGADIRRNYSLCSSPLEKRWRVGIKKVPGGLMSTWANETLRAGDTIDVMPPMGKFTPVTVEDAAPHFAAFAAGSGITPVLSIISTVLATNAQSRFTLVYGNQSRSSIMFREELEALKNKYVDRLAIYHMLSREKTDAALNYGRIDAVKCRELFSHILNPLSVTAFYLCGPEGMSHAVKAALLEAGVPEQKIRMELFTAAAGRTKAKAQVGHAVSDQPLSRVTIRLDGVESSFDLAYDSDPILDAGLHEGLELPFACKGGMCCTCKAKLMQGEVDMEVHYGLEHDEIEAGFILTCQSHPKTAVVVVDFDAR